MDVISFGRERPLLQSQSSRIDGMSLAPLLACQVLRILRDNGATVLRNSPATITRQDLVIVATLAYVGCNNPTTPSNR